jgi:galactokinase
MTEVATNIAGELIAAGMSGAEARRKADWFGEIDRVLDAEGIGLDGARRYWVPGRLEFLGKHTDYAGGRSLLCAIERGICLTAVPRRDCRFRIRDIRSGDVVRSAVDESVRPEGETWGRYAVTVARRMARNFDGPLVGAELAFASDLPPAAGMSSSSALVTAAFIALAEANGLAERAEFRSVVPSREALAAYLGAVENGAAFGPLAGDAGVGTSGGCQDHAAILLGRPGALVQYAFLPLRFEQVVAMPDGQRLLIATSGIAAEKAGAALARYNAAAARAAAVLAVWNRDTGRRDPSLAAAVGSGAGAAHHLRGLLRLAADEETTALADRFEQFQTESEMIIPAAAEALADENFASLGALVDLSQECAERLLGNQIPETTALARSARELGATAASAFGAGFGGSVWALVPEGRAERFQADWARSYRRSFPEAAARSEFFVTRAGPAATRVGSGA